MIRAVAADPDVEPSAALLLNAQTTRWCVYAAALIVLLSYWALLGAFPLSEPDEARYAEIPREMLERGDWVTPHLNYVKYFEKPPLVYWLTALSFRLFGMNEFSARLSLGIFALTGIGMAYVLGCSVYGPWTGVAAAALLAATPLFFGLAQFLTLDMALSAWMSIGLGSFWLAYKGLHPRRRYTLLLYAATGLAVLTKGPVAALLIGGIILIFLLLRRDVAALRWVASPPGIVLFALVTLPWFILVSVRNPEFPMYFVAKQHLQRYLRPIEHQEAVWFYIPILFAGTLPWSAFALSATAVVWPALRRLCTLRVAAGTLFLAVWCGVIVGFFSGSGSKLGPYVVPMLCPLAVLMARILYHLIHHRRGTELRYCYWIVLLIGAVAAVGGALTPLVIDDWVVVDVARHLIPSGCVLMAAAGATLWLSRNDRPLAALAVLWLGMMITQMIVISGRTVAENYPRLGDAVRTYARPEDLVVSYGHYVQGLTFYGRRRVVQVEGPGELEFGRTQGDQRAFFWQSDDDLLSAWGSAGRMFLAIRPSELEALLPRLQPSPRPVVAQGKELLVANFPADD